VLARSYGEHDKPDSAGFLTYGAAPATQDPAELDGFDVAIVGAPGDDLVSDRPGRGSRRARSAPRAVRRGRTWRPGSMRFEKLRVVDFGDAPVLPADPVRSLAVIEETVGPVHFDTHADTGTEVFTVRISHGTPFYRLVEAGQVVGGRYAQIGLRGYWPGRREFAWQAERGSRPSSCATCGSSGSARSCAGPSTRWAPGRRT
jgi:arginase family enzyme